MKDYKLSEIKKICSQYAVCKSTCIFNGGKGCGIKKLFDKYPSEWKIEENQKENNNGE